jgi:putative lipoprotein
VRAPRAALAALVLAGCVPEPAPPPAPPAAEGGVAEASTPWHRSLAEGYTFRGVGQEPGWTVEIAPEREVRAVLDYGERTLTAPAPRTTHEGGRTVYHAEAPEGALRVEVEPVACADAMSGERMTHTVALHVDGRELRGCGRELFEGMEVGPAEPGDGG